MKDKSKTVYIAGPMRGLPKFNYPEFNRAEIHLRSLGYEVINPARMSDLYGTPEELIADKKLLKRLMNDELREIAKCDAIYLLRGWAKSVGARKELSVALQLDLEVLEQKEGNK